MKIMKKLFLLLASVAVLAVGIVGGTVAYMYDKAEKIENTFEPTSVPIEISETFENSSVKKDVYIKNIGNTDAYIRAEIIVTWVNAENKELVYSKAPVLGEDYTMNVNTTEWKHHSDGYYYYTKRVAGKTGVTANLINECKPMSEPENRPSGYVLNVEIVAQSIQADGVDLKTNTPAVTAAWSVDKSIFTD